MQAKINAEYTNANAKFYNGRGYCYSTDVTDQVIKNSFSGSSTQILSTTFCYCEGSRCNKNNSSSKKLETCLIAFLIWLNFMR